MSMMFPPDPRWFQQQMKEAEHLPVEDVTEEEFIRLFIEQGMEPRKAKMQAVVAKGLGSHARIGNKMVGIKEVKDEQTA